MLANHDREKLINAIIYFCNNTTSCNKIKLLKLLYFLDFEHFAQTGRSVTGLEYEAWEKGPVPVDLYREMDLPKPDLAEKVSFRVQPLKGDKSMLVIEPIAHFDASCFTKRELSLLKEVADRYAMSRADEMIWLAHQQIEPWHRVYEVENRKNQRIPYEYALTDGDDIVAEEAREHEEMIANYS